jgi:hypothetical protein
VAARGLTVKLEAARLQPPGDLFVSESRQTAHCAAITMVWSRRFRRRRYHRELALVSGFTKSVARNVTIRISDEAALWARRQAAEENTSVSRLVGEMLERHMRLSDHYWRGVRSLEIESPIGWRWRGWTPKPRGSA